MTKGIPDSFKIKGLKDDVVQETIALDTMLGCILLGKLRLGNREGLRRGIDQEVFSNSWKFHLLQLQTKAVKMR